MAHYEDGPAIAITASLYLHIPFCAGACDYCDFYSLAVSKRPELMDAFIDVLLADVEDQLAFFEVDQVPTVYVGGGTPSMLGAERAGRLFAGLSALLPPVPHAPPPEFTVEANPESADGNFLRACRDGGVNRISLGVQSFYEPSRRSVHRVGERSLLQNRLALTAGYFPEAFSADLIAGLPFQTEEVLLRDIDRLLSFAPSHVSLYSLTVEPGTPLAEQARFREILPPRDEADALWLAGRDALEKAGLWQYEVSNFARPGKACAHNIRYWRMKNWLGAGPAASGTIVEEIAAAGRRYTYPADLDAYLAAPRPALKSAAIENLDRAVLMRESLLMGFRCREGPDPALFRRRFSRPIEECIPRTIARWQGRGFFAAPGSLAPSREGLLFLDAFLRDAFGEMNGGDRNASF